MGNVLVAVLGLFLVIGSLLFAASTIREALRWVRLARSGETVQATIVGRRLEGEGTEAGTDYFITAQWTWMGDHYENEYAVPARVYQTPDDVTVPIRIDPDDPQVGVIEHWSSAPLWKLTVTLGSLLFAAWGVVMILLGTGVI